MNHRTQTGRSKRWVAAVIGMLVIPSLSGAQDQDRDQDRDQTRTDTPSPDLDRDRLRDQVRDRLKTDAALSDAEVAALAPEIDEYASRSGDPGEVARVAREAKQAGCTSACLRETIRTMNRAMHQGMDCPAAGEMTRSLVREQTQSQQGQSVDAMANGLRERTTTRLRAQDQGPDGQHREMIRETQREQRGVGSGTGGGGAGGGGGGPK